MRRVLHRHGHYQQSRGWGVPAGVANLQHTNHHEWHPGGGWFGGRAADGSAVEATGNLWRWRRVAVAAGGPLKEIVVKCNIDKHGLASWPAKRHRETRAMIGQCTFESSQAIAGRDPKNNPQHGKNVLAEYSQPKATTYQYYTHRSGDCTRREHRNSAIKGWAHN